MSDTTKDSAQDTQTPDVKVTEKPAEAKTDKPAEKTIADLSPAKSDKSDNVPLATFLETKTENKKLREAVRDLEAKVQEGASKVEVSTDIAKIGEKYKVDATFLGELTQAISAKATKEAKAEREAELQPLLEADRQKRFDEAFGEHFAVALANLPEYAEIANKEVIKTLAQSPANASKTLSQLIEETYGKVVTGKRTVEDTTPAGGKEPETIDYARASKDNAYLSTILANPVLKAEYNKDLHKRIKF